MVPSMNALLRSRLTTVSQDWPSLQLEEYNNSRTSVGHLQANGMARIPLINNDESTNGVVCIHSKLCLAVAGKLRLLSPSTACWFGPENFENLPNVSNES